jgi:hypothetical protein
MEDGNRPMVNQFYSRFVAVERMPIGESSQKAAQDKANVYGSL